MPPPPCSLPRSRTPMNRPTDDRALRAFLATMFDLRLSEAPFRYLADSFFERLEIDAVCWACRGGGKTFVGAVATALDL